MSESTIYVRHFFNVIGKWTFGVKMFILLTEFADAVVKADTCAHSYNNQTELH